MDAIIWTILTLSVIALIAIGFVAFRAKQRAGSVIASTDTAPRSQRRASDAPNDSSTHDASTPQHSGPTDGGPHESGPTDSAPQSSAARNPGSQS